MFCTVCKTKIDEENYLKDRTLCKNCYKKSIENSEKQSHNRTFFLGQSLLGKTHVMMKVFSRKSDRDIYLITMITPWKVLQFKSQN